MSPKRVGHVYAITKYVSYEHLRILGDSSVQPVKFNRLGSSWLQASFSPVGELPAILSIIISACGTIIRMLVILAFVYGQID